MKYRILNLLQQLSTSHWFMPLILSFCSVLLLSLCIWLDLTLTKNHILSYGLGFQISKESIQQLMTIIITVSISITCVILSITMLTLSFTSNLLGPRLIPNFIRQGKTQTIIGVFISIYIYCLTLLTVSSTNYAKDNPMLITLYVGIGLALTSFIMLIYFIHHISQAIQVSNILEQLSIEVTNSINRLFLETKPKKNNVFSSIHQKQLYKEKTKIIINKQGYIQTVNYQSLKTIATENNMLIELIKKSGHFIFDDMVIGYIYHNKDVSDSTHKQIINCLATGKTRTSVQDIEYGFDQIAEIAVRALSPGINNPYTAINCIHKIGYLLQHLSKRFPPESYLLDEDNKIRVVSPFLSYKGVIDIAINQIRQNSHTHVSVTIELIKTAGNILALELPEPMKIALQVQAKIIYEQSHQEKFSEYDKKKIESEYFKLL